MKQQFERHPDRQPVNKGGNKGNCIEPQLIVIFYFLCIFGFPDIFRDLLRAEKSVWRLQRNIK